MKRRIGAALLALCMLVALTPAQVFATGVPSLQTLGEMPQITVGDSGSVTVGLFEGSVQSTIAKVNGLTAASSAESVAEVSLVYGDPADASEIDLIAYAVNAEKSPQECTIEADGFAVDSTLTTSDVYDANDTFFKFKEEGLYAMLRNTSALAITLPVPKDGYYALGVQGVATNVGATCNFAIGSTEMGQYSFYKSGSQELMPQQSLGLVYLEKGTASVVLTRASDRFYVNLSRLSLIPVEDTVQLHIVGKQVGTTTVTVSGTVGVTPVSYSFDLTVKGQPGIAAALENEAAFDALSIGETASAKLNLVVDGISAGEDDFTVLNVEVEDPLLAKDAAIRFEDDGVYLDVVPTNAGTTNLLITAATEIYGEKTIPISITTVGKEYIYSMLKLHKGPLSEYGNDPDEVTDWAQTTMGDPKELNPGRGVYTDPWIYIGPRPSDALSWGWVEYGLMFEALGEGAYASFGIDVPTAGAYTVSMDCLEYFACGITQVYLAPMDVENPRAEQYKLGAPFDTYAEIQTNVVNYEIGTTYLEAGKYVYTVEIIGKNPASSGLRLGFGAIHLKLPTTRSFAFEASETRVMSASEKTVSVAAMCNGYEFSAEYLEDIVLSNENEDILTASVRSENGKLLLDLSTLKEGNATLTLSANYRGEAITDQIVLEVVSPGELVSATLEAPVSFAEAGEEIPLTAAALRFDGTTVSPGDPDVTFVYSSSNTDVLTVNDDGVIQAKGMGTATITVYVTRGEVTVSAAIPFTVTSHFPLASVELHGLDGVAVGAVAQYSVRGRLTNGAPIPSDAVVEYFIVSNPDGAIELSETGLVSGMIEGAASIKAKVTMADGSSMETAPKAITVYQNMEEEAGGEAKEVFINMVDHYKQGSPQPRQVSIADAGWQVNQGQTAKEVLDLPDAAFRWQIYGLNVQLEGVLTLDIAIPGDGYYQLAVSGGKYHRGAHAQFFMNGAYLGSYDMNNPGEVPFGEEVTLNTVYLKRGVHPLYILRGTHTEESDLYLYLGSLRFTPVSEVPTRGEVAMNATKALLSVGESGKLLPGTQLSDKTAEYIGYDAATLKEDPNNVIKSLTLQGDSIRVDDNNLFYAVKPGTTTVIMDAVIDGVPYQKTLDIVVDGQTIGSVTAVLEHTGELHSGDVCDLDIGVKMPDGRSVDLSDVELTFQSTDSSVADVVDGVLKVYRAGSAQITVSATLDGKTVSSVLPIQVAAPELASVRIKSPYSSIKPGDEGYQLNVVGVSANDVEFELQEAQVQWTSETPSFAEVSASGYLTPKAIGEAVISAEVLYRNELYTASVTVSVREGKTRRTYYTEEKMAAVRKNIEQYDWAKEERRKAVEAAEDWLDDHDDILEYAYSMIPTQEVPRGILAGYRWDPNGYTCKYCETDLRDEFSYYPWEIDAFNYPWKIQCPKCKRRFPSNDFGAFYEAGKDEHGNFSYEKALKDGAQYLVNVDFPEKGDGWAVDDSRGYKTGKTYPGNMVDFIKTNFDMDVSVMEEAWPFIAYYNHYGIWNETGSGLLRRGIFRLKDAYLYTNDPKYGRIGAILIDRVADLHPEMSVKPGFPNYFNSDSSVPLGKELGCIWQSGLSYTFAQAYDAFYPMYDDPYVVNFLSKKAAEMNLGEDYYVPDYDSWDYDPDGFKDPNYVEPTVLKKGNPKTTPALIRQNIEENLILEIINEVYAGHSFGNFGMAQSTAAMAAVVLDTMPYSGDMIDWIMAPSSDNETTVGAKGSDGRVDGGNVLPAIMNIVSRDGTGNEGALNYNWVWSSELSKIVDALSSYDGYAGMDLFENPKFLMMYKQTFPQLILRKQEPSIGDSGRFMGTNSLQLDRSIFMKTGDVEIGQLLYWWNGNSTKNLSKSLFEDSETLEQMVKAVIAEHGEYDFDRSEQMTGYGFSINRGGTQVEDNLGTFDSQRFNYLFYGITGAHGHQNKLDLGMGAFGINIAPDFGYPESADGAYRSTYRDRNSIVHNVVLIDDKRQIDNYITGKPMHFDDAGRVKLVDVEAPHVYSNAEEYRRSVMMVEVDDENAYTVDFFRVKGGDSHLYSFHAASNLVSDWSDNLEFVAQSRGTYAGPDVPLEGYKTGGGTNGFDFFYNVRRAAYPGESFGVDFKINEYPNYASQDQYHLKMTMLNDFDLAEVALATCQPPQVGTNPKEIEFVLARREGKVLDSLFTTVYEPYDGESYIASQESVPIKRIGGAWETEADASKAIKITLKNGRVDYIVYATNNNVLYSVDNRFEFQGFVGVYTLENDDAKTPIYAYMNDGVKIGDMTGNKGLTGTVVDFRKEAVLDNYITVSINEECDPYSLIGEYIYIENDGADNAVYEIKDVTVLENGDVRIGTDMISMIRGMADAADIDKGYVYNIAKGQSFVIPYATVNDDSPIVDEIAPQLVTVGDTLEIPLSATTKSGAEVTFKLGGELRNAGVADGKFYFSPTQMQIGKNHAAVTAVNGALETTVHFSIEVFAGSSNSAGGGGGSSNEEEITYEDLGNNIFKDSNGNLIDAGPDKTPGTADDKPYEDVVAPTEKFADLGNHAWAKDAIYRLVDADIIKGVAEDEFAPAAQITRADFATLLVRAWSLTVEELGTFEDVAEADYYYETVGIASALGIVKGVGENKFDPKAPITREQMMVMLNRTLAVVEAEVAEVAEDVLTDFGDADEISEYAVESVKLMVGNGYIQGTNGKINPQGNATRAEVAVLLDRILNQ